MNQVDESWDVKEEDIIDDWVKIQNRICAEIARILWGNDYYYHIMLNQDLQFQTAIENLENAKSIMY